MDVIIKETGVKVKLELIDFKTNTNCVVDLIGNHDGLGNEEHQFLYDEDENAYICSQATFEWWDQVVSDQQALEDRIEELIEVHGSDRVNEVFANTGGCDLEDLAAVVNRELDEVFGK